MSRLKKTFADGVNSNLLARKTLLGFEEEFF